MARPPPDGKVFERYREIGNADLTMAQTLYLTTIHFFIGNNGHARVSQAAIASQMNVDQRTVGRLQKQLEEMGVLEVVSGKVSHQSNDYIFHYDRIPRRKSKSSNGVGHAAVRRPAHSRVYTDPVPDVKTTKEKEEATAVPASASTPSFRYPDCFEEFWQAYPKSNRGSKADALREYTQALTTLALNNGKSETDAQALLTSRAADFSASYKGQNFPYKASNWLHDGRFDEPPEAWAEWSKPDPADVNADRVIGYVRRHYSPDVRDTTELEKHLTGPELAQCRKVGLRWIAYSDRGDQQVRAAYKAG